MAVHTSVWHPTELARFHIKHALMFMVQFTILMFNFSYVYIKLLNGRKTANMDLVILELLVSLGITN
jgi:hypothetical protein